MRTLDRRAALQLTAATTGASLLTPAARGDASELRIVDTNVHLAPWPFRRLPLDRPDRLAAKLTSLGVHRAWTGSFEALLHRDLRAVNARLSAVAAQHEIFLPIGAVNPRLPDWEEDLRVCVEVHRMPGVRIYPNYHQYTLASAEFLRLLRLCQQRGLLLQIAMAMEDVRTQHPTAQVADVDPTPLTDALRKFPNARVQLLNFRPRSTNLASLGQLNNLFFDTARVESTDGVPTLAKVSPQRTLFGSHAPLLIPEAAMIRVHESNQLDTQQLQAIYETNADALLRGVTAGRSQ